MYGPSSETRKNGHGGEVAVHGQPVLPTPSSPITFPLYAKNTKTKKYSPVFFQRIVLSPLLILWYYCRGIVTSLLVVKHCFLELSIRSSLSFLILKYKSPKIMLSQWALICEENFSSSILIKLRVASFHIPYPYVPLLVVQIGNLGSFQTSNLTCKIWLLKRA